jgi:hypothetical protein
MAEFAIRLFNAEFDCETGFSHSRGHGCGAGCVMVALMVTVMVVELVVVNLQYSVKNG